MKKNSRTNKSNLEKKNEKRKAGLGIKLVLSSIKDVLISLKKKEFLMNISFPIVLDMISVFMFFGLLWFVFAPRIHNALVMIMGAGQKAQESFDVAARVAFSGYINDLLVIVVFFLLVLFLFWCLLQGTGWYFLKIFNLHKANSMKNKILKSNYLHFVLSFFVITFIFLVPILLINSFFAKYSFNLMPHIQILVLWAVGLFDLVLFGFMFICYGLLANVNPKEEIFNFKFLLDLVGLSFKLGFRYLLGFFVLDLFVIGSFYLLDLILRLVNQIHHKLYLVIGFLSVFFIIMFVKCVVLRFINLILKNKYR